LETGLILASAHTSHPPKHKGIREILNQTA
jgi:hypothetical protein